MHPSIVLHQAVHNRPEYTRLSIQSVGDRTLYPNFTWIVSAIACDQQTTTLLSELQEFYPYQLRTFTHNVGQWKACEAAWHGAPAPLLSHIQNDILVPYGWLSSLQAVYAAFHPLLAAATPRSYTDHPPPDFITPSGLGLLPTSRIAGTCFLLSRQDWLKHQPIHINHPIFGFGHFQERAKADDKPIGFAWPLVKIIHMDRHDYPHSLRETTYKRYTDRIYQLRHNQPRPPGKYP